jgi:hypothetical protein
MEESDLKYAKELVTLDGKPLNRHRWQSVFMLLSQCDLDTIEMLDKSQPGLLECFITLTDSFICANTYDNIQRFVEHNIAIGLCNKLFRR